jgi:hypothetical protein
MDRTTRYRDILTNVVHEYARFGTGPDGVETYPVIDHERGTYVTQMSGWDRHRRIHGSIIHLDLRNGKIWVQHDGTDLPVVDKLEEAGVPRDDIVLGFISPSRRQYTDYAVG